MSIIDQTELTPRESIIMENERDENRLVREHAETIKRLELELQKDANQAEIELKKLQAKWASWLHLPAMIIKLPLYVLLGVAYICSMFTKKEMPRAFWKLLE